MNKKQLQAENILKHGFALQRIYPETKRFGPVELCKKLHRLEVRAARITNDMCSYPIDMDKAEKSLDNIETKANEILGSDVISRYDTGPVVFINRDPRGYALKIRTQDAKNLDIHKDWGGYGIICPEF